MHATDAIGRLLGLFGILRCLALHMDDLHPIAHLEFAAATRIRDARVDRVVQWMHVNLGAALRMEEAAAQAHISTAAFSRFFKRETGKTFTDYLNDVRCAQACAWLSDSVLPVSTITSQCGFETSSHFNRQFKSRFGVTPRDYRKRSG
jgi:AraC-like DNA-binding protein